MGRLYVNSDGTKNFHTNNEKIKVNVKCNSHFVTENSNKNRIEPYQPLVYGRSGRDTGTINSVFYL